MASVNHWFHFARSYLCPSQIECSIGTVKSDAPLGMSRALEMGQARKALRVCW